MPRHKFKVGQSVCFTPGKLTPPAAGQAYEIVRALPAEDGEYRYRIKSVQEPYEANRLGKRTFCTTGLRAAFRGREEYHDHERVRLLALLDTRLGSSGKRCARSAFGFLKTFADHV